MRNAHHYAMSENLDPKLLRCSRGWTQEQMADYLGLDRSSVSRIENGAEISGPVRRLLEMLQSEAGQGAQPEGLVA